MSEKLWNPNEGVDLIKFGAGTFSKTLSSLGRVFVVIGIIIAVTGFVGGLILLPCVWIPWVIPNRFFRNFLDVPKSPGEYFVQYRMTLSALCLIAGGITWAVALRIWEII